ncbi:hypothetical protein BDN67DRAFT_860600, partial [Paxillus ammoniavirescens]
ISRFLSSKGNEHPCTIEEDYVPDTFNPTNHRQGWFLAGLPLDHMFFILDDHIQDEPHSALELQASLLYVCSHSHEV